MFNTIRKSRISKGISLLMSLLILQPYFSDPALYANGGGPVQPEYASYTAVGNTDFVDPFSGNVQYNVPLFEIGGFPITMSYSGDINPQQDAGWVGLGWSLNLGSVNRALRGVPDDFDGDEVLVERNNKPAINAKVVFNDLKSETFGLQESQRADLEKYTAGGKFLQKNFSLLWDNNTGIGIGVGASWEKNISEREKMFVLDSPRYQDRKGIASLVRVLPLRFLDTVLHKSYAPQMQIDYDSKSRTSLQAPFGKNFDKLGLLNNGNLSFNSRSSQFNLGFTTGFSSSNLNCAYSPDFSRNYPMRVPSPDTRTRTYTRALDYSRSITISQKRKYSGIISITEEYIIDKSVYKKAYGYFNMKDNNYDNGSILDQEELPNSIDSKTEKYSRQLSPATKTCDVFNFSAPGIGGSFRAHHNSVFMLSPTTVEVRPYVNNLKLKGEIGKSETSTEVGVDIGIGVNSEKYGAIPEKNNPFSKNLKYKGETVNQDFEPMTFRNDYEFIENDLGYYDQFGSTRVMSAKIKNKLGQFDNSFINIAKQSVVSINDKIVKNNRDARQQVITCNKAAVAAKNSLFKTIDNYWFETNGKPSLGAGNQLVKTSIQRIYLHRKAHHLSEVVVTQPDGSRYFFSTPVYSKSQKEVSFDASSLNKADINYVSGLAKYASSDLKKTDKGTNARFYESTTTPAYASTFLLNGIISSDYVDVDDNGPSENDLGNYVKINYSMHRSDYSNNNGGDNSFYKWRSPMEKDHAHISPGYKSDILDDKAYYSYGEKELWYAHSIETKDEIAFFYLRPRLDGWEVKDELGGVNQNGITQLYIQQIVLFTKKEFYKNGLNGVPLKTVNFDYSYDLCKNYVGFDNPASLATPHPLNASINKEPAKGKLTLHKIWFTYGKMAVNTAAPYVFEYGTNNPDYSTRSVDRWGTYMPQNTFQAGGAVNDPATATTADRSYTPQDNKSNADLWASAWMLKDITLPTGGKVHFEFEADDYAYVQDKKAQRMCNIVGWNNEGKLAGTVNDLYKARVDGFKNYYVIFKKPLNVSADLYYKPGQLVYYSMNVKMNARNENSFEQVSGFFEVEYIGDASDNSEYAYIKVKPERAVFVNAHPVTRMALQYGMVNVPFNLYPGSDLRRSEFKPRAIADMIFGVIPDAVSMLVGKYTYFENIGHCQVINPAKSFIRLPELDGFKYGGGHRVKSVTMNDNWNKMTELQEASSEYTLKYTYTTEDENKATISSGVASYEPGVGADENPFKLPLNAEAIENIKLKRFKPVLSYEIGPVGEEFFGAPNVGYSKVKTQVEYPNSNIIRHKAGYTVKEFYTAKDYPTFTETTPVQLKKMKLGTPNMGGKFSDTTDMFKKENEKYSKETKANFTKLSLDVSASFTYHTASQGITVETNDMHGKLKAEWSYAEDNKEPLSGTKYFYKNRANGLLSNEILVLRADQSIAKTTAGLSIEPTIYSSQNTSTIHNIRPNVNVDIKGAAVLFNIMPGYSLHKEQVRLITTTKHISRRGIVDSVVVYDKGANTSTKNLAWDALTGQVLLSSFNNEYGDEIYSLVKPAHWMYKGMSGAYQNQNLWVELTLSGGIATDPTNKLFKGDELYLDDLSSSSTYYVLDRNSTQVTIVNASGSSMPNGTYKFRVKRSGCRNILGNSAEAISLMKNPLNFSTNTFSVDKDWVIDAKAFVYSDIRKILPTEKFCYYLACQQSSNVLGTVDTTAYGHQIIYNNVPFISPIVDSPSIGRYFGRPMFSNCCLGGGFGTPPPEHGGTYCFTANWPSGKIVNDVVNPYTLGIRGIWSINGDYVYFEKRNAHAQRKQDLSNSSDLNTTTMRYDGRLSDYKEFWTYSSGNWQANTTQQVSNPWTWKETVTDLDNEGNAMQSENALNVFSSVLYGHKRRLMTAQAANSKVRNMMFESFEDIDINSYMKWRCDSATSNLIADPTYTSEWTSDFSNQFRHWPVSKALMGGNNRITDKISHTGWKSIQLGRGETEIPFSALDNSSATANISLFTNYHLQKTDFVDRFFPESNNEYYLSLWVKETYRNQMEVQVTDASGTLLTLTPVNTEASVDGWRQISVKFTLTTGQNIGSLKLINKSPLRNKLQFCYVDDIRITPMKSAMKCYVYDYKLFRLMATLDDNNFATYYEYDEEGELVRTKVETEKGMMTVNETRKNTRK